MSRVQAPFWSDDFDMDLPKVVPAWLELLGDDVAAVELLTYSGTFAGRINCPASWDHSRYGGVSYFGFEDAGLPEMCSTYLPVVSCTFAEVVRDLWVHGQVGVVGGVVIVRADTIQRTFERLMHHRRKWVVLGQDDALALEHRVERWIRACGSKMHELLKRRQF